MLVGDTRGEWTVRDIVLALPDVSVEQVRTTVYLLLGDGLVEVVKHQRVLTVCLASGAANVLARIVRGWVEQGVAHQNARQE